MKHEAQLNGTPVEAKRVNNIWLVGGDKVDTSNNSVLIRLEDGKVYALRGAVLKFHGWEF